MSEGRLKRAAELSEIASAIVVIVGLALAVWGVYTERNARKERYTFDYVSQYFGEDLREKRNSIRATLHQIEADLGMTTIGNHAFSLLFADHASKTGAVELRFALVSVFDFYSGAKTCVEANLCDIELIRTMVGSEAQSLVCLIGPAANQITLTGGQDSLLSGLRLIAGDTICA